MKAGRFGAYVNHGKINATIPKGTDPASLTLEEAIELLKAKAAGGGVIGRLVGEHPDGGPVTVRDGRFGAYVNWGKVNATIPKGTAPDSVTLSEALELIAEREGKPAARPRKAGEKGAGTGARLRRPRPPRRAADRGARAKAGRAESGGAKKLPAAQAEIRRSGKRRIIRPAPSASFRLAAHGLDVVAVGVEDEGAVIIWMVVGPRAGRAIVPSAGGQRRTMEGVDFGARGRGEGDMRSAFGLRARADPEERLVVLAEAGVGVRRPSAPPSPPSRRRCRAA